jgi:hypothetical protein
MTATKTISVKLEDLISAFEFVSASPNYECSAFISRETGQIFWASELGGLEEAVPDDLDDEDRYIVVPHKNDLNLGRRLVFDFVHRERPGDFDEVSHYFRRRGAYQRFKAWLHERRLTQQWYDFEQSATDAALRSWCGENDIELLDG